MKLVHPVTDQLEPDPLDPADIVSGSPETSDLVLATDEEANETCGFWSITPGVVTDTEVKESSLIFKGRATVSFEDGSSQTVGPGDVLVFEGGEKTTWTVEETIFKAFWIKE